MAFDIPGDHGNHFHNSDLRFLLEGAPDPRKVAIRTEPGCRQEGGWSQGFFVWLW
jgi:hypothetical protein